MKRTLSVILVCLMLICLLPFSAVADDGAWTQEKILRALTDSLPHGIEDVNLADYPTLSGVATTDVGDNFVDESEPNDTAATADAIQSDDTIWATLSVTDRQDLYRFTMTGDGGMYAITVSNSPNIIFGVFDVNGNCLCSSEYLGMENGMHADALECLLPAGNYYLGITSLEEENATYLCYFESHVHTYSGQSTVCDICGFDRNEDDADDTLTIPFTDSELDVLRYTNMERQKAGLAPLTGFAKLQEAARVRAEEINGYFSHTRPSGESCFTVLDECGLRASGAGENIASGYPNAKEVVAAWMDSEGHRANILEAGFAHLGVGRDGTAWEQLFLTGDGYTDICVVVRESAVLEEGAIVVDPGTTIEDMELMAILNSKSFGECYLPVLNGYCTGYDASRSGLQTVTISVLGVQDTFEVLVTGQTEPSTPPEPSTPSEPSAPPASTDSMAVYRLYNQYTNEHLLVSNEAEKDNLVKAGWSLDGVAWNAPTTGDPVYRLYNPYGDFHFYTMSMDEVNSLLPLGWTMDGPVSCSAGTDGQPVYRLFNPYEKTNYHMFTASEAERDYLASLGWVPEGVAWYASR